MFFVIKLIIYLPYSTKSGINGIYTQKYTLVQIFRKLKIGQSTVSQVLSKYKITGSTYNKIQPRRNLSFKLNERKFEKIIIKKNENITDKDASRIQREDRKKQLLKKNLQWRKHFFFSLYKKPTYFQKAHFCKDQ